MAERTERTIRAELATALENYRAAVPVLPGPECEKLDKIAKALQVELSQFLSRGANPCPLTGLVPHGMKKRPGVYEVGPIDSPLRARGETAEEAVEAWNAGLYVPPKGHNGRAECPAALDYEPVGLDAFATD